MTKSSLHKHIIVLCAIALSWLGLHVYFPHLNLNTCLVKWLTDFPCPACGITRAFLALMEAKYQLAFSINPLVYPTVIGLLILPLWILVDSYNHSASFYVFYSRIEAKLKQRNIFIFCLLLIGLFWRYQLCK